MDLSVNRMWSNVSAFDVRQAFLCIVTHKCLDTNVIRLGLAGPGTTSNEP